METTVLPVQAAAAAPLAPEQPRSAPYGASTFERMAQRARLALARALSGV